jgi:putative sigma-54 modulation protein
MNIDVKWSELDFNKKSKSIVAHQLQILLWRFRAVIMRVRIRFSDANGPKGGRDKQRMVSAKLRPAGKITIKSAGMDYLEVFQSSFERLILSVQREIAKQRQKPIRINRRGKIKKIIQND